jgi:hypothetical protein
MKLTTFKRHLAEQAETPVGFVFDDGDAIPPRFHVTEVGHITKRFIDCGGTVRTRETVQLQVWLGRDEEHRLTAGKLARILELAAPLLPADDLDVEVEYEGCVISQSTIEDATVADGQLTFRLGDKHTDCLAKEPCGVGGDGEAAGCCGGAGCG